MLSARDKNEVSAAIKPAVSSLHPLVVLALLLAVPLVLFWKPVFFYILDDWTALIQMTQYPLSRYVMLPDGEQWFPFFHLVFYGLVKMAGEQYSLLVLINCLGTGLNAFLLYLFFRRHWTAGLSLTLSLLYACAAVHHAIAWNGFYIGYLLSLGFFLGALLLTDSYLRFPSAARLGGIFLCSLLSVLSHNYTLTGLLALPLYLLLVGGAAHRRQFWLVSAVIAVVYAAFACGYLLFAGLPAAASHNPTVFSRLPSPAYLVHLLYGAFLAPFFYLFWGHYHFPVPAYVAGAIILTLCLAVIWRWGGPPEKHLALWALAANALPFLLVSLTRYQRSLNQAFVARYGIFTLIGALLLVGTAWRLMKARASRKTWSYYVAGGVGLLVIMVSAQLLSLPLWSEKYLEMSRLARKCYALSDQRPEPSQVLTPEEYRRFCPTAHPTITPSQVAAIRRLLNGWPGHS